ncbi:MAG: hypothetical protein ABFD50_11205 [Smithella sp.]
MEEETSIVDEVISMDYDSAGVSFDFIGMNNDAALVCEQDAVIREKITKTLTDMNYHVTESATDREALKNMRFHTYDLIIIDENFAMESQGNNEVLTYLQNISAAARRNALVTMLSDNYRTMDNMAAFNKSVNLVINRKNIDDFAAIIKRGLDENKTFYNVFRESLKKTGRI